MGRRQRNKQAPPTALGATGKPVAVAGGKRKAPAGPAADEGAPQPKSRRGVRGGKKNHKPGKDDPQLSDDEDEDEQEHGFGDFDPNALQQALDGPGVHDEDLSESEEEDLSEASEEDVSDDQHEEASEEEEAAPKKKAKKAQSASKDADGVPENLAAQLDFELPDAGKLTGKKREKALAEIARLEQLLKSQGYSLESDEEKSSKKVKGKKGKKDAAHESEAEVDDDESLTSEQMAFLDAGDDADELEGSSDEEDGEQDEFDLEGAEEDPAEAISDEDEDEDEDMMLPTLQDAEQSIADLQGTDLKIVQQRMNETVTVLTNWKSFDKSDMTGARSRAEYVDMLLEDICSYYGYNRFLAEKFFDLFPPAEAMEFFEANEMPRPVTIRTNTLRTRRRDLAQALINRGVSLEPLGEWSKVGLQVFESSVPVGATPEYLAGQYMLQAASSFLPCIALAPQPGERVLDMASAPGGKSTYLSALMQNTGVVFANDANKARIKSLTANVHRLGCKNVVVCNYDGRMFPKVMGGFDRVLLDSPCSGTGVISKDASVKTNKSERDMQLLTHLQKQLILCAIDSINARSATGGYVVYSTCSVLVEEDEEVVEYALRKRPNVKLVPTGVDFGRDGFPAFRGKKFDPKMTLTKRIFPHVHNLDGFFVAKLKVCPRDKTHTSAKGDKEEQEQITGFGAGAGEGEGVPASKSKKAAVPKGDQSLFNDEEDASLIQKSLNQAASKKAKGRASRST